MKCGKRGLLLISNASHGISTYYFGRKIIGDLAGNVIIAQGSAEPSVVRTYVMLVLTFVP